MFDILRKHGQKQAVAFERAEQDNLNHTATGIAIKLIQGDCNAVYKREMTQLFIESPGFIDDVAPEYRGALQKVLKEAIDSER